MSNSRIGDNIKKLRKQNNYSLEKVSKLADLSLNTIVKVESGVNKNPTIETLNKIANAFSVGINDLIK